MSSGANATAMPHPRAAAAAPPGRGHRPLRQTAAPRIARRAGWDRHVRANHEIGIEHGEQAFEVAAAVLQQRPGSTTSRCRTRTGVGRRRRHAPSRPAASCTGSRNGLRIRRDLLSSPLLKNGMANMSCRMKARRSAGDLLQHDPAARARPILQERFLLGAAPAGAGRNRLRRGRVVPLAPRLGPPQHVEAHPRHDRGQPVRPGSPRRWCRRGSASSHAS